ncbi:MAG: ATP-binding protein [Nanobdellota archaeon]
MDIGIKLDRESLKKHFIALGSSGSGKTVLTKAIIEEATKEGIPSVIIDPQGDLSSLALGLDAKIFTPGSSKGIPLSINPLKINVKDKDDRLNLTDQVANSITKLIGYDPRSDKGSATKGIFYTILSEKEFSSFEEMIDHMNSMDQSRIKDFLVNQGHMKEIIRKLKLLTIGRNRMIFEEGEKLDFDRMMKGVNIIYLNSLVSDEEKEFFVAGLVKELYEWMLKHPSQKLQALFVIDEIAPYLPAGARKPITKEILKLLYKQARKYGLGCIVATQNPGDIDYMAFAQFGTWAVGRLTTKQDRKKVQDVMKENIKELPSLKPGEFVLFSPDNYAETQRFSTRKLKTEHKTLTEDDISAMMKHDTYHVFKLRKSFWRDYTIVIDPDTGKMIDKNGRKHDLSPLYKLGKEEIKLLRLLKAGRGIDWLSFKMKKSEEETREILKGLKRKNLCSSKKKNIEYWYPAKKLPRKLRENDVEGKKESTENYLDNIARYWFKARVLGAWKVKKFKNGSQDLNKDES